MEFIKKSCLSSQIILECSGALSLHSQIQLERLLIGSYGRNENSGRKMIKSSLTTFKQMGQNKKQILLRKSFLQGSTNLGLQQKR